MIQLPVQHYLGVLCVCCRQPIPLPANRKEAAQHDPQSSSLISEDTRMFNLRCNLCEKENFYNMADVIEIEGSPRLRTRSTPLRPRSKAARAANG
jgi:hypothetical protein